MGKQQPQTTAGGERELSHVLRAPQPPGEEGGTRFDDQHLWKAEKGKTHPQQIGQRPFDTASCDQPWSSDWRSAPAESPMGRDMAPCAAADTRW